MIDLEHDILYGDCPGFEDSNGTQQEIVNAFAINYLLKMLTGGSNKIKILLVIGSDEIVASRSKSIYLNFQRMEEMFPNKKELKNGFGIIFTRADPCKEGIDYIEQLNEEAKPLVKEWCNFFMEHEDRVFTLPKVTRNDIDKEYEYEQKGKLIEFLTKDQLINPNHFISLSETAKNDLEKELNKRRELLDDLLTLIFETIYSQINKIDKTEKANEWSNILQRFIQLEIHDIKELRNALKNNLNNDCLASLSNYLQSLDDFEAFDSFISQAINIQTNTKIQKIFRSKATIAISQLNLIKQHVQTMELREKDLKNQKELLRKQEQITQDLRSRLDDQMNESNKIRQEMQNQKNESNRIRKEMEQQMKNHNDELKKMNEEMNLYKNYDMVEIKKPKKFGYLSSMDNDFNYWNSSYFYENKEEVKGLLETLADEMDCNLHDDGIIEITSNSINGDDFLPRNLVDYKSSNSYASKNYINSYFCIDLIDQRIQYQ